MRHLFRGEPEMVIRAAPWLISFGILVALVSTRMVFAPVITALFAISLGASGRTFEQWRTDRGLWMLAGLFFLMNCGFYVLITVGQLSDILGAARAFDLVLFIDFTIGTTLLVAQIKFLKYVGRENWKISREKDVV
ncbi:hypothetical protein CA54_52250 [Symmachiella macrocystis]|uniref:Uncharacterized protein n=1 Tax=Symmachiella macrocystis TaxID=2527985 RepID=A0A5C6B3F8_9PLAN|nr:hypothetical protein [Symmachiella macrocystis]TWU06825.1 hypothetical protein CA54_52250 [Symmachiella macrocystis]